MPPNDSAASPRVALYATCLVDLFRPSVGFASAKLLEQAGCQVEVPPEQTCCGQPAFNSGDARTARDLARRVIEQCEGYDYVVLPSGSCAAMIRVHYPELFADDAKWRERAAQLAAKTYELVSFLVDVRGVKTVASGFTGKLAYHDSCSGLRELGIREQPRRLLASMKGLARVELSDPEACCGFGGTFCVKFPEISTTMVAAKAGDVKATGADTLAAGDLGCLLNIAGWLKRGGSPIRCFHVAEILAGMTEGPGIGDGAEP
ncbi:MAG: (Fe-S)-binding protein [Proteobacteria bacterium]|nr:MAG: (Fe-S)-binding protein [Pseudomonadota bacterium]QKK10932.1 MAG: (Fe-S)-binding protein [Pseudomonadota bacterium]